MTALTKRRLLELLASAALGGVAGCGSAGDNPAAAANTETPTTSTETAAPATTETPDAADEATPVEVQMITDNRGSYFDPKGLLIESGTTLRFVNDSGVHAATAYHPDINDKPLRIPTTAEPWDSGLFSESGATFEVTLETEGVYDFYCPPHESLGMVGRIIVGEPQGGPGTTPPEGLPPAARERLPAIETIRANGRVPGP